jgi:3-oxoacyl-[acyl-carrier protein] reductase
MDLNLKNKVALITGGSKGIGAGIAKALAEEGVAVAINYASNELDANKVVKEIISNGGSAIAVKGDVSKKEDVQHIFAATKKAFGAIDILVNNAGIFQFDPIEAFEVERFQKYFNTNVLGVFLTIQEALNHFPPEGGSIINIGAALSQNPNINGSLYSATKAAVDTLTMALAKELSSRNIRVNTVAPGPTVTEGSDAMSEDRSAASKHIISMTPLGRLGTPEDIAKVVVFFASNASFWVTGERISASGGLR